MKRYTKCMDKKIMSYVIIIIDSTKVYFTGEIQK